MANKRTGKKVRLTLVGANGRMGTAIAKMIHADFAKAVSIEGTIGRSNLAEASELARRTDIFLDVSLPEATEKILRLLVKAGVEIPYVVGCTGWNAKQLKTLQAYAKRTSVVMAPNFSPGVNLFLNLVEHASPLLARWGYDVSIHEIHHARKIDSPSGTAKAIAERLVNMKPRIHATRSGDVVGTHEVRFVGPADMLSMTHEAFDRSIFARGAIMAVQWAIRQVSPGFYSMKDVIFSDTFDNWKHSEKKLL